MKKNDINSEYTVITSVDDFLRNIQEIKRDAQDTGYEYFYRGQANIDWKITPGIFRDNFLVMEHKLFKQPLQKIPKAFFSLNNCFDILTMYQHYQFSTRLLDITTNPLVALYFACNSYFNANGVVYFCNNKKSFYSDEKEIQIIAEMIKYDFSKKNTLKWLLQQLTINNVITETDIKLFSKNDYAYFIDLIQGVYIIKPFYNNERLIRQSGAFLLPGKFNFYMNQENLLDSTIIKAASNLDDQFDNFKFVIEKDYKTIILKELDELNINEASLFPELDRQLNYIKESNKSEDLTSNIEFIPFTKENNKTTKHIISENIVTPNESFDSVLKEYIKDKFDQNIQNDLYNIIMNNMNIDRYKKETTLSKIKFELKKIFITKMQLNKEQADKISKECLDEVINKFTQQGA